MAIPQWYGKHQRKLPFRMTPALSEPGLHHKSFFRTCFYWLDHRKTLKYSHTKVIRHSIKLLAEVDPSHWMIKLYVLRAPSLSQQVFSTTRLVSDPRCPKLLENTGFTSSSIRRYKILVKLNSSMLLFYSSWNRIIFRSQDGIFRQPKMELAANSSTKSRNFWPKPKKYWM